jgi:hypothetical protein
MSERSTLLRTIAVLAAGTTLPLASLYADGNGSGNGDENGDEAPFAEADVFFELNDTDGDLGIHALVDGRPWKMLELEGPNQDGLLQVSLRGRLRRHGLTELFFESAEPNFDDLPPAQFFRRFPEGEYEVSGITLEGTELESVALVTHVLPAPPEIFVSMQPLPENCDEGPLPVIAEPFVVTWPEVTHSHPTLGRTDEPIEVVRYQVVVEREEPALDFTANLPPEVTSVELPMGLMSSGDEIKVEVLVREASGNQTATESCFEVE